jgi:hypothetical protein
MLGDACVAPTNELAVGSGLLALGYVSKPKD